MNEDALPAYVELINHYLDKRGIKIKEAALEAGVKADTAPAWVSRTNPTRTPPLHGMVKLANWLAIPPQEFFDAVLGSSPVPRSARVDQQLADLSDRLERVEATLDALRARDLRLQAAESELRRLIDEARNRQDPGVETGTQ